MIFALRRSCLQPRDDFKHRTGLIKQADRTPVHPDDEIGLLFAALEEALPGLRGGITAIANADLTGHRLAAVQCFSAMAVGEFQM
jgi:hypothetical protein